MSISRAAVLAILLSPLLAMAAPPALTPAPYISGLSSPVELAHANDGSGRLFVVEQAGRIRIIRNNALLPAAFLDIRASNGGPVKCCGEQGLLGLAFHPAYLANGRFFVFYTRNLAGDANGSEIVVERYTRSANPDVANPTGSIILTFAHPQQGNHNGGKMAFGADGYLYIATGDGGGGGDPFNAGQSLSDLRGKILRIDVDGQSGYAIPASNPFVGVPGARGEIWAYGLRNPWKFSVDRATGDFFIGDVGQGQWEEINFEPAGAGGRNYGWRVYEGTHCFSPSSGCSLAGHTPPIIEYGHNASGGVSVTGGFRYRGTTLPALAGFYVYGDFGSSRIWAAEPVGGGAWTTTQVGSSGGLSTFGEDEYGELYVANHGGGTVLRLTPAATASSAGATATRYRLYHQGTLDHLYTTDLNEYNTLPSLGWTQEGAIYRLFDSGGGSIGNLAAVPYYRLYMPASQQHHWTTDANEYAVLPAYGYVQEGIDGYILPALASGTVPVYRLYHPAGMHVWTTDANERAVLSAGGWVAEGIAGYALPLP